MIGHQVPVLELRPGQEVHLEPHQVRGVVVSPVVSDVQVESWRWADTTHQCVIVHWCSCGRYPGAQPGYRGCTLYSSTSFVLVIGGAVDVSAVTPPTVIMRGGLDGPSLDPLPGGGDAAGTRFTVTCADGERIVFPDSAGARALVAVIEAGISAADNALAERQWAKPPADGEAAA